jgi:hypothetical protein
MAGRREKLPSDFGARALHITFSTGICLAATFRSGGSRYHNDVAAVAAARLPTIFSWDPDLDQKSASVVVLKGLQIRRNVLTRRDV